MIDDFARKEVTPSPERSEFIERLIEDAKATPSINSREMLDTDTKYKAVDYIETYTGRAFFSLDPNPAAVSIIDIAHALSNQCRYGGHTESFYSTAQHCCILASYVENVMKGTALDCLQILLHDAAEAYLVDMQRPIKQHMPQFRKWDSAIQMAVRQSFGLTDTAVPPWQDEIDSRIIVDERAQIMSDSGNDWKHDLAPLKVQVDPWLPKMAEQQFLFRFAAYMTGWTNKPSYINEKWGMTGPRLQATVASYSDTSLADSVVDLIEVDMIGGVGRVKLRSEEGMLVRDTQAGKFPRPATKWVHGKFQLLT